MSHRPARLSFALFAALLGCSSADGGAETASPSAAAQRLVLAADPGEARSVVATKVTHPEGRIVVEGRVANVTPGVAALELMDTTLTYCGQEDAGNTCPTPWDYCHEWGPRRTAHGMRVEARDADGALVQTPTLADLRLLDRIKVVGRLAESEGSLVLLAEGYWRVERPELPGHVTWPQ